jgi:hypothetical protein
MAEAAAKVAEEAELAFKTPNATFLALQSLSTRIMTMRPVKIAQSPATEEAGMVAVLDAAPTVNMEEANLDSSGHWFPSCY